MLYGEVVEAITTFKGYLDRHVNRVENRGIWTMCRQMDYCDGLELIWLRPKWPFLWCFTTYSLLA